MIQKKKRMDFEDWYNQQLADIDKMTIAEVRQKRESLKGILENIHVMIREEGITDKRKSHLIGRRRFVTQLLSHTKKHIKQFNVVYHEGVPRDMAVRFVQIAAEELSQEVFQRIYGLAAMGAEEIGNSRVVKEG